MEDEDFSEVNPKDGKVRQVCQTWQILEDEGLAYRLQNEEINDHYDRNRQNSRLVRDDFRAARREQFTEQELLECTRRQEEAEAEELAEQLALLLDEERKEEDAMLLDEQLARKLAQEDDEAIAREQQDRELARMLQAKERLKAKKLREIRRRREEAAEAERTRREEVVYANLAGPFQTGAVPSSTQEYATASQQTFSELPPPRLPNRSEPFGHSSIYLLRNSDVVNPAPFNSTSQYAASTSDELFRGATPDRSNQSTRRTFKGERNNDPISDQDVHLSVSQRAESHERASRVHLEELEGSIPPYMPMQGLSLATPRTSSSTNESVPKKNTSCKTQ